MKIKDIARVQGGYAFKSDDFIANAVPVIRIGNLDGTNVNIDENTCYRGEFWEDHPEFRVNNGDILIAMSGATVGKTGRYQNERKALLNQRVCSILPKENVEKDYLYYFCLSPLFRRQIQENAFGCAQPNISGKQIEEFAINVPNIQEQKNAVDLFEKISDVIALRKHQLDELDNLIKSQFVEMFGDPVRNDKKWERLACKKLASKIGSGATPKGGNSSYKEEGISLIRSMNVYNNTFQMKDLAFIDDEQAKKLDNVTVEKDDVLLNITGASVARCCIVPEELIPARVNQHVSIIRCKQDKVNPIFLSNMLTNDSYQKLLWSIATSGGATREALTKQQVEDLEVIIPTKELQQQFATFVQQVDKLKFEIQKSLDETQTLFDSLMQQYFG